jgi:hypothetical protein
MRLKWTDTELKYFNKKIPTVSRTGEWIPWVILMVVSLCGLFYLVWR